MITKIKEDTALCTICGTLTEWDYSLKEKPKCVACWDAHAAQNTAYQQAYRKKHRKELNAYREANKEKHRKGEVS